MYTLTLKYFGCKSHSFYKLTTRMSKLWLNICSLKFRLANLTSSKMCSISTENTMFALLFGINQLHWIIFFLYIFVSFCLLDFNRILYETLAHSQQNWKTANEQSIKTNTLYRFVNESIMAAIQTHCHLFSLAWYYTHNSVYIYIYIHTFKECTAHSTLLLTI